MSDAPRDDASAAPFHLANRLTYGPTPQLIGEISADPSAWLAQQLQPAGIADTAVDELLAGFPVLHSPPAQLGAWYHGQNIPLVGAQWQAVMMLRQTRSRRQVAERIYEFWSDHLHVPLDNAMLSYLRPAYDRDVIRAHAFGRYADMLRAAATHPAMLVYLDNWVSTQEHPNENHAREMLELHTVGVDGGYGEGDVTAAARLLTGMTVRSGELTYQFSRASHDPGQVEVLGWRSRTTTNEADIGSYLNHLARHRSTAHNLATRLARRFVSDDPPASLVEHLATTYLDGDTALGPVYAALFRSSAFAASARAKLRRPSETVAWTMRTWDIVLDPGVGGAVDSVVGGLLPNVLPPTVNTIDLWVGTIHTIYATAGQTHAGWPGPDGAPDDAAAWSGPAFAGNRARAAAGLVYGTFSQTFLRTALGAVVGNPERVSIGDLASALTRRALGRQPTGPEHQALLALVGAGADKAGLVVDLAGLPAVAAPMATALSLHPEAIWR